MLNRRDAMIRLGQFGFGAAALPGLLRAADAMPQTPRSGRAGGRAKSVILLYLWGGPPQQDMWDLKPDTPETIRSEFRPIHTRIPGIQLCDQLPLLAGHTDKLCVLRSMSHDSVVHEPSVYYTLTGKKNPTLSVPRNQRKRSDYPNFGAMLSAHTPAGDLPTCVTVPRPIGHDGVTYAGTYAGWLGPRHDPMELKAAPNTNDVASHPLDFAPGLDATRLIARRGLVDLLDRHDRALQSARSTEGLGGYHEQAHRMITSSTARRAFLLDQESTALRDRYGHNEYGESFLLARRLVEAGVKLVSVNWMYIMPNGKVSNVWDTHGGIGGLNNVGGFDMLRAHYCLPPLDRAFSALLEDLEARGLLEETLVVVTGEFGRTPRINSTQGREHWGPCYGALLAGGGVRGGQVLGASDKMGAYVRDFPISPEDLLATIYHALGIAPDADVKDREGRPVRMCEGRPVLQVFR
jgi:hypothetical protein